MPVPNPFTNPKAWTLLSFVGSQTITVPGVVTAIDGIDIKELWLVQKAQDSSYAVTIWRGRLLNESIKIDLAIPDQATHDAYTAARDVLQPKPPGSAGFGKQPTWLVANAALNYGGITRVGIVSMGTPKSDEKLVYRAKIELIQYRPFAVSKVGPPDPPKQQTENDRLAAELEAAMQEARKFN